MPLRERVHARSMLADAARRTLNQIVHTHRMDHKPPHHKRKPSPPLTHALSLSLTLSVRARDYECARVCLREYA